MYRPTNSQPQHPQEKRIYKRTSGGSRLPEMKVTKHADEQEGEQETEMKALGCCFQGATEVHRTRVRRECSSTVSEAQTGRGSFSSQPSAGKETEAADQSPSDSHLRVVTAAPFSWRAGGRADRPLQVRLRQTSQQAAGRGKERRCRV